MNALCDKCPYQNSCFNKENCPFLKDGAELNMPEQKKDVQETAAKD